MTIVLPGWDCPNCQVFNGEAKEPLDNCRHCATPKPSSLDQAFAALQKTHRQALENLTEVQAQCTELVLENRALRAETDAARLGYNELVLENLKLKEELIKVVAANHKLQYEAEAAVFQGRPFG
jgi:hypothetical protein